MKPGKFHIDQLNKEGKLFSTPVHYFDQLPLEVREQIQAGTPARKSLWPRMVYITGGSLAAVLLVMTVLLINRPSAREGKLSTEIQWYKMPVPVVPLPGKITVAPPSKQVAVNIPKPISIPAHKEPGINIPDYSAEELLELLTDAETVEMLQTWAFNEKAAQLELSTSEEGLMGFMLDEETNEFQMFEDI